MNKFLSDHQVVQYRELGFVAPVDVMDEDDAMLYRERLESAERDCPDEINPENRNNAHLVFMFLDELVHHPIILDAMEDLMGPDLALWSTVLFIKESRSSQFVSWHQDATYMGLHPHEFATPWLALTPSNSHNGCMSMIPGSHLDEIHQHQDTFADDNILTRGQEIEAVDESSAVDLVLRPGQMSIHHARTIHGSRPNQSKNRRVGIAMQAYMAPHVRQTVVDNSWLTVRGENRREGAVELHRPRFDMDPMGVADRKLANENLSRILYHGADRKRAY